MRLSLILGVLTLLGQAAAHPGIGHGRLRRAGVQPPGWNQRPRSSLVPTTTLVRRTSTTAGPASSSVAPSSTTSDAPSATPSSSTPVSSTAIASESAVSASASDVSESASPTAPPTVSETPVVPDEPETITPDPVMNATTTTDAASPATSTNVAPIGGATVDNKILIFARDAYSAQSAYYPLDSYGIPYEAILVPQEGITLPALTSATNHALYSGIIIMDALSYEYSTGWASALSADQWTALHNYQIQYGVRMVRINEYPSPSFGSTALDGCCDTGVEQLISLSDTSEFPTANLKTGAGLSTQGLWHYPAVITDPSTTKVVAQFAPAGSVTTTTAAAVINTFPEGREQFVWFTSWAPQWSTTAAVLQHAHVHWMTRGVFLGKRKSHLNIQIDDLELPTDMYYPGNRTFRVRPADLAGHAAWQNDISSRLPPGSNFRLELGHNGNGDLIYATDTPQGETLCHPPEPVDYDEVPETPLEFMKPLGTGQVFWPSSWTTYPWTLTCAVLDTLTQWYQTPSNRDAFFHVSHTFTHLELNNATYGDAAKEIQFNQAWLKQVGIAAGSFSANGLIPPAITGLHNGDVIKAWLDNGIQHVVGDNTRPVLRSTVSQYWPLISTVEDNGYAGLTIVPRWATSIYYNCDDWDCDVQEWKDISQGYGTYVDLLENAKTVNTPYLFSLMADPYMFHQANLRLVDMPTITVGTQTAQMSMVMGWVESVTQEFARLTNWPIVSLGHDQFAAFFIQRMTLDQCKPSVSFTYNADSTAITQIVVSAQNLNCAAEIPVTIPSGSVSGGSIRGDQVGLEPPIQWVTLSGAPVTLTLNPPVNI